MQFGLRYHLPRWQPKYSAKSDKELLWCQLDVWLTRCMVGGSPWPMSLQHWWFHTRQLPRMRTAWHKSSFMFTFHTNEGSSRTRDQYLCDILWKTGGREISDVGDLHRRSECPALEKRKSNQLNAGHTIAVTLQTAEPEAGSHSTGHNTLIYEGIHFLIESPMGNHRSAY